MLCGDECDRQRVADPCCVPPVELAHVLKAERTDQPRVACGDKNRRREEFAELPQGREIKMVIVIVTEQDEVDFWQVVECHAGLAHPPGTYPAQRTCPFG